MSVPYRNKISSFLFVLVTVFPVIFSGCAAPQALEPIGICQVRKNITEAADALAGHRQSARPIKAGGNCIIEYYDEGKPQKENLDITLRFYPPDRLYFRGNVLGQEAISMGVNSQEFYLRFKPKELSSYYWGQTAQIENCPLHMQLNPNNILEALGMALIDTNWILSSKGHFDILTRLSPDGKPQKRIFVNCSNYLTDKIEYFDHQGKVTVAINLSDYTNKDDGIVVPRKIKIVDGDDTTVDITLKNVRLFKPWQSQLEGKLFKRPEPKGIKNIYMLSDGCDFVRQQP